MDFWFGSFFLCESFSGSVSQMRAMGVRTSCCDRAALLGDGMVFEYPMLRMGRHIKAKWYMVGSGGVGVSFDIGSMCVTHR